ncbi:2-hydroxy-6-oxo-6-phenylhexa-2,4-dienoate hydrolase [Actinomadura rubteroloni]|uniref:2-hydroxy-6-oxo-6-phenylhexa-2,4-dienoate hydrolase n=1 Tax=Actinomadura rubteroloni TaxID=1926885 RepID=A0A2P4UIP8_9ACTN|nr:alpha/beta fold hydrolase [Actinomadura rubteroloni]POM24939.1 2-hydroxy-6-oxo-6-phenylhexa-2,4-dienoate hydrolase [Actinomadura rubteroloni]
MTGTSGERLHTVNGVELCVETFGDRTDPAVLLVAGSSASMLWWDARLCERIAAGGRYVVRYDHRDTGRSTASPPGAPTYSYTDLARDALGIQDVLGIERAHLVCQSMFGGIGLILGVDYPERVASLTFVSTSTGADDLPPPSSDLKMPDEPDTSDTAAVVRYVVASAKACAGGHFDEPAMRALAERDVARARNYASTLVNHYVIDVEGLVRGGFGDIAAPTLVVHGDRDPLLPLPHGEALRDAIPGADLLVLEGAGHDVPEPVWDAFVSALLHHTRRNVRRERRAATGARSRSE